MRAVLIALALSGCSAPRAPWQLAAVYDATALGAPVAARDGYLWTAAPGMAEGCGPTSSPVGLGVTEAEAISAGLTPTLAILLAGDPDLPPLGRDDVQVAWRTDGGSTRRLEPAVLPPAIRVSLKGMGGGWRESAAAQAVAREVCLEHKVGRAWVGGDAGQQRKAFLHDVAAAADPAAWFLGQGSPVPALLGPPYACLEEPGVQSPPRPAGLDAEPRLQVGDVWNASLPPCPDGSREAAPPNTCVGMPIDIGAPAGCSDTVTAQPTGTNAAAVSWYTLSLADDVEGRLAPPDPLAEVPLQYPGGVYDPFPADRSETRVRLVLLLVPAWQLTAGGEHAPVDPVGDALADLSRLSVGVAADDTVQNDSWKRAIAGWERWLGVPCWMLEGKGADRVCGDGRPLEEDRFHQLNPYWDRPLYTALSWGYPFDALPESVLGGAHPFDARDRANAHRAGLQGLVLALGALLVIALVGASLAIPDLWRRWPEVSLDRWVEKPPGRDP